eukprot:307419-Prymnesium_polylepis.1
MQRALRQRGHAEALPPRLTKEVHLLLGIAARMREEHQRVAGLGGRAIVSGNWRRRGRRADLLAAAAAEASNQRQEGSPRVGRAEVDDIRGEDHIGREDADGQHRVEFGGVCPIERLDANQGGCGVVCSIVTCKLDDIRIAVCRQHPIKATSTGDDRCIRQPCAELE